MWDKKAQIRFKRVFSVVSEKAKRWILGGIKSEISLNRSIPLANFVLLDENIYAKVLASDLNHVINIGKKFFKAPLLGRDSQVVTLCHEMSHFDTVLGTDDFSVRGMTARQYAISLAVRGDERTMKSSYNFEMYFE